MTWRYVGWRLVQFVAGLVFWALSGHERRRAREGSGLYPAGWFDREP